MDSDRKLRSYGSTRTSWDLKKHGRDYDHPAPNFSLGCRFLTGSQLRSVTPGTDYSMHGYRYGWIFRLQRVSGVWNGSGDRLVDETII
jgi:hypothetical protein